MEIILIRHTSVDVPYGVCYGQSDVPLRDSFEEEADQVMKRLNEHLSDGIRPDAVFTSPLSRCTRLAERCGYPQARRDDRLKEIDFGAWEMVPFSQNTDPRLQEWYDDYLHVAATDGESFDDFYLRVNAFFDELLQAPYRRVLIFAHGGVLMCAQIKAGIYTMEEAFQGLEGYGAVISVEIAPDKA